MERQCLANDWEPRAGKVLALWQGFNSRHWLAITAATEHFTAVFADWLLANRAVFDNTEERLKTLWLWHSAEESEHKCTAFDLYLALGGSSSWRVKWFRRITLIFLMDLTRPIVNNLYHDGTPWKWPTWTSAAQRLVAKTGQVLQKF